MAGVAVRRWSADPLTLLALIVVGATASALVLGRPGDPAAALTLAAVVAAVALSGST
jgi:hypothetical protein